MRRRSSVVSLHLGTGTARPAYVSGVLGSFSIVPVAARTLVSTIPAFVGGFASAVTAPARSAIDQFIADVDSLFVQPVAKAAPADRAKRLVDSIDWSQPTIVIWVPGTSEHDVPARVADALRAAHGPNAYFVDYVATWQLKRSVPDGEATLRATLELAARRKRPGQRLVLIGESQGAWLISSVLRDPALAAIVDKASLVAHPGLAPAHVHESESAATRLDPSRVREFNREGDVVARDLGASSARALDAVDAFADLRIGEALGDALAIAVTNPGVLGALIASQLFRVEGKTNPHESADFLRDAVQWILAR